MDLALFFKSALIGLSIAAPVGPVGLLCIQRSLLHGARIGFLSGLGAALADACFGALGAFGVQALIQGFVALATPLALLGAGYLAWMGIRLLRTAPTRQAASLAEPGSGWRALSSVFALTLTNPMTILAFVAVFAGLGAGAAPGTANALLMVAGVFCGSALWWLALALGVAAVRHRLDGRLLRRIDQVAGLFLLGFAAWQLARALGH
ncbi:lysine transporter LysE [Pseudomonas solani]|uniref:Lysine transporter LysE n=1 Tax=Pseudomonas solani TaxID=2731552 RepID=A0ABM7LG34_9PSED|nr:LysE family translocator [Pseudomonas solani]BCD88556.1 lysine transporter LysE [Pseudomonas solani]